MKENTKQFFKKFFLKIPVLKDYIRSHDFLFKAYLERHKEFGYAPGHYLSPIPDLQEVQNNAHKIFGNENIADIEFNTQQQFDLLQELTAYYSSVPYAFTQNSKEIKNESLSKKSALRYDPTDAWYRYSDVIFLIAVMQHFKPKKVIEIGSGHSSAVMLDANEIFFEQKINLTFIEPFPRERLNDVLKEDDRKSITIIENKVQEVDVSLFRSLEENDILFVDSTHVSKIGSDVNHIFFNILPILKPGVLIHFHDIFYPFELPANWIFGNKWFWNEVYILRAFLMNNADYKIVLFNSMLQKKFVSWFEKNMPDCLVGSEETGSIWVKKLR